MATRPSAWLSRPGLFPVLCHLFVSAALAGQVLAGGTEQAQQIQRLLTHLPQAGVQCSSSIVDLETGQTICEVNPSLAMLPASCAKVFIIAAVIDLLGPDFAFRTSLVRQGPDLVVIGDGDPSLGDQQVAQALGRPVDAVFQEWVRALEVLGVTSIPGDLVIDESIFDGQFIHPDWERGDLKKWYAAPVGALNYNGNCLDVTIRPADQAGVPVLWECVPETDLLEFVNRCKSGGRGTPLIDRPEPEFRLVVSGRCSKPWTFPSIPVPDPGLLTASAFRTALADRGITVAGRVVRRRVRRSDGTLPDDCQVVAVHTTPLGPVLARAGKRSQNLFAECLLKRLGYEWARKRGDHDPQGNWATGRAAIQEFLTRAGADAGRVAVADGSGLSRANRSTAADLTAVLRHMHRHRYRDLFVESLSIAGIDGTLRKRLGDLPGRVYAKTGYLRGTRTLSGYAVTPAGRWRAFAILFQGFKGPSGPYNDIHDQVCRILATDPPGDHP